MNPGIARIASKFIQDNSPAILTSIGVAGTITTAVLTGRASFKAAYILQDLEEEKQDVLTGREKFEALWPLFVGPVVTGALTVTSVIGSAYVGNRRAAAIAAAYALSERALTDYKEKVVEKLGSGKERALRDELAQERVTRNPVNKTEVIMTGGGTVLCYDLYTGRYFYSSMEALKRAENEVNHTIINNNYASLSDFYSHVGLTHTKFSDDVGWNMDELLELSFSTTMSDDDRPCIAIDFRVSPIRNYHRIH